MWKFLTSYLESRSHLQNVWVSCLIFLKLKFTLVAVLLKKALVGFLFPTG